LLIYLDITVSPGIDWEWGFCLSSHTVITCNKHVIEKWKVRKSTTIINFIDTSSSISNFHQCFHSSLSLQVPLFSLL
jgi:hypothetical protein